MTNSSSRELWDVFSKVIDAAGYVAQHRERIYIVCFDQRVFRERPAFEFPESQVLIPQGAGKPARRLTPQECGRLMGFDKQYHDRIAVSDTQAYKQFGNAVVPEVVEAVAGLQGNRCC